MVHNTPIYPFPDSPFKKHPFCHIHFFLPFTQHFPESSVCRLLIWPLLDSACCSQIPFSCLGIPVASDKALPQLCLAFESPLQNTALCLARASCMVNIRSIKCEWKCSGIFWFFATLWARILQWVAIPSSRGSSWPRDRTWVSCIAGRFFTVWASGDGERKQYWIMLG